MDHSDKLDYQGLLWFMPCVTARPALIFTDCWGMVFTPRGFDSSEKLSLTNIGRKGEINAKYKDKICDLNVRKEVPGFE